MALSMINIAGQVQADFGLNPCPGLVDLDLGALACDQKPKPVLTTLKKFQRFVHVHPSYKNSYN